MASAHAQTFRSRIGSMRKALKSRLEFTFIDAPYEVRAPSALIAQRACLLHPPPSPARSGAEHMHPWMCTCARLTCPVTTCMAVRAEGATVVAMHACVHAQRLPGFGPSQLHTCLQGHAMAMWRRPQCLCSPARR